MNPTPQTPQHTPTTTGNGGTTTIAELADLSATITAARPGGPPIGEATATNEWHPTITLTVHNTGNAATGPFRLRRTVRVNGAGVQSRAGGHVVAATGRV